MNTTVTERIDSLRRALSVVQGRNEAAHIWPFEKKMIVANWYEVATPDVVQRLLSGYDNCETFGKVVHDAAHMLGVQAGGNVNELVPVRVRELKAEVERLTIKDHQIAAAVGELTIIANTYGGSQQVRARISEVVLKLVKAAGDV